MPSKKPNVKKGRELFSAIKKKDGARVRELLEGGTGAGAALTSAYMGNLTALTSAAGCQFPEAVRLLLAAGADPNAQTTKGAGAEGGWTALHAAISGSDQVNLGRPKEYYNKQRLEIVELLLQAGASPDAIFEQDTLLWSAACAGYTEILQRLIRAGANPAVTPPGCLPALHGAANTCQAEIAILLLKHGANLEDATPTGQTPLMLAAFRGCDTLVNIFLEHGAQVNRQDQKGKSALIYAADHARHANVEETQQAAQRIMQSLLKAGADPNAGTSGGQTALDLLSQAIKPDLTKWFKKTIEDG